MPFKFNPFTDRLDEVSPGGSSSSILTINTVAPDGTGNFTINAGSGVTITPGANSITISATGVPPLTGFPLMFFARSTGDKTNVTGDGTIFGPIIYEDVDVNVGSCYDPLTGVFTVPETGIYMFECIHYVTGPGATTGWALSLQNQTTSSYSSYNCTQLAGLSSPGGIYQLLGGVAYNGSLGPSFPYATAGDQIYNSLQVLGGAKTTTLAGYLTYWACYKVN